MKNDRRSRAKTFNEDALWYEKIRPGYPPQVFTNLKDYAQLNHKSKILEVGCGTGQATSDLLKISKHLTCIEPGEHLLQIAKEKFPELTFVNTTFEALDTNELFDIVFAATSWHWVDSKVGYEKASRLLKKL